MLFGPTGGYIVGFVLAAALTGWLAQRRWERRLLAGMLAFVAGSVVVFLIGLPWLKVGLGPDLGADARGAASTRSSSAAIIKAVIAALALRGAWALVARADRSK